MPASFDHNPYASPATPSTPSEPSELQRSVQFSPLKALAEGLFKGALVGGFAGAAGSALLAIAAVAVGYLEGGALVPAAMVGGILGGSLGAAGGGAIGILIVLFAWLVPSTSGKRLMAFSMALSMAYGAVVGLFGGMVLSIGPPHDPNFLRPPLAASPILALGLVAGLLAGTCGGRILGRALAPLLER